MSSISHYNYFFTEELEESMYTSENAYIYLHIYIDIYIFVYTYIYI
jgi:hypothetical protein